MFYLNLYNFMLVADKVPLDATRPHPNDAVNPLSEGVWMLTIIRINNLFHFSLFVTNDQKIVTIVGWIHIFLSYIHKTSFDSITHGVYFS